MPSKRFWFGRRVPDDLTEGFFSGRIRSAVLLTIRCQQVRRRTALFHRFGLFFAACGCHIRRMAKTPAKIPSSRADRDESGARKRRSPLTDFMDASEPLHGFGEAPQPELSGTPLSGSIADWAEEIAREAEISSLLEGEVPAKRAEGGETV